jgi:hypothetical protein
MLATASRAGLTVVDPSTDSRDTNGPRRDLRPLWSPSAGYRDARVRGIAAALGNRPISWTVDSGD